MTPWQSSASAGFQPVGHACRRIDWVGVFPSKRGEFNRAEWRVELLPTDDGMRVVQHFRYLPQTENARNMLAALGDASGIAQASAVNLGQL